MRFAKPPQGWTRKYHPDVILGKSAREVQDSFRGKRCSQRSKKRKIYDQSDLSDNIDPAHGRGVGPGPVVPEGGRRDIPARCGGQGVPFDFRRLRLFHLRMAQAVAGEPAAAADSGYLFRHLRRRTRRCGHRGRPRSRLGLEYQVNVPFWTAIRGGVMRLKYYAPGRLPATATDRVNRSAGEMFRV